MLLMFFCVLNQTQREYGDVWSMEYGIWSMEYGIWSRSMEYGVWNME